VVFEGFVPPVRVPAYLARARVGVCPYPTDVGLSEFMRPGGSLKLLELLANGIPAVASDLGWIRDLAVHGRDAWLVEPDSPEALAEGVRTLLDDPALASRLAEAGRERAAEYSWERRAARLLEFVDSLHPRAV
jgi:glycosyltransferase involved in cell wall biosynthesis